MTSHVIIEIAIPSFGCAIISELSSDYNYTVSPLSFLLFSPAARWGCSHSPPPCHEHLCLNSSEHWALHYPLHSAPFDPGTFATLMPAQYKQGALIKASLCHPERLSSSPWFQIWSTSPPVHFVPFDATGLTLWSMPCTNWTHQSLHIFVSDRRWLRF